MDVIKAARKGINKCQAADRNLLGIFFPFALDKLVKLICKNEDELNASLTERQTETFEKFKDCQSELTCITERKAFSSGLILATRIMVEVMQGMGIAEYC